MRVDEHTALLDAEAVAGPLEYVAVAADIFADALVAPVAVADEIGGNGDEIAVDADDAHIRDHAPRARFRIFGVAIGIIDADDALADALAVVGNEKERVAVIAFELVVGRNVIGRRRR